MSAENLALEVRDLRTHFFTKRGVVKAVDGVSLSLRRGEILGLVGESGSGKSITGFSILGLVDHPGRIVGGSIRLAGEELIGVPETRMRQLRGSRVAMIFQDPMMTLNPVLRIETQMVEAVLAHENVGRRAAWERARDTLGLVGIPSPDDRMKAYPHQFSGGMRQRVSIAIALLHRPVAIIADEPTTALDVSIQAQILSEIQRLCKAFGVSILWISHDLGVVAGLADRMAVMYAGRIVEEGAVNQLLDGPIHPYTLGLLQSYPGHAVRGEVLRAIRGLPPPPLDRGLGCSFRPRCDYATDICQTEPNLSVKDSRSWRCFHPREVP